MKRLFYLLSYLLPLIPVLSARAQHITWEALLDELTEEEEARREGVAETAAADDGGWTDFIDELHSLHENPINLNTATAADLARLYFLSPEAIEGLLRYRDRYGAIRSVGELAMVEAVGWRERQLLHLFAFAGPEAATAERGWGWRNGRHELTAGVDVPLYERAGWPWGCGLANRLRYEFRLPGHIQAGIRAETDAGEPMMCRQTPLWDAQGAYAALTTGGWMETLAVGDFKAVFGEGLVAGSGFRMGKAMSTQWRTGTGLRPHSSMDEVHFLRGIAATARMGRHWTITALYSYRRMDAVVQADNTVYNLSATGLHRTASEQSHRGSVGGHTAGGHLGWQSGAWAAGLTAMADRYDHVLCPGPSLYQQIAPYGYRFGAVSMQYSYRRRPWQVSGETARSFSAGRDGWACLHRAMWHPKADVCLTAIHRFYSQHYFAPHANAFGENSRNQNESGLCVAADMRWVNTYGFSACIDYFYSPFPRYTMTRASRGGEGMMQGSWQTRRQSLTLRYQLKSKERSDRRYWSHRIRLTHVRSLTAKWDMQAQAQAHLRREGGSLAKGYAVSLAPRMTSRQWRWRAMLTYFHTDDFDSRIALYEPSITQTFSIPSLFYHGLRTATTLRWQSASARWILEGKGGLTRYMNRDAISSGATLISSPWKADIQLIARLRW